MAADINIDRKNVQGYLSEYGPFTIPVYQRPYTWSEDEELQTLFDDLTEYVSSGDSKKHEYFLGCIVSCKDGDDKQEIIDGQQRLTTLFLILRAIYSKCYDEVQDYESQPGFSLAGAKSQGYKTASNFCDRIKRTLWQCDKKTGDPFYDKILLESKANNDETNVVLHEILKKGVVDIEAKDQYSKNYRKIKELLDEYASEHVAAFYDLVDAILDKIVVLPIWANDRDIALTIFDTLNNRGKPLSDADIFKAKIFDSKTSKKDKDAFIGEWKNLETEISQLEDESMQKLFTYYMYYLRGRADDVSTTAEAVRKYYKGEDKSWSRLSDPNLMSNLKLITNIFKVINRHEDDVDEPWASDIEIRKSLDIIRYYPNEYWKYPVIIYYLEHHNRKQFVDDFNAFLHKLISQLLTRFVDNPSLNHVKSDILKLDAAIKKSPKPEFSFKPYEDLDFKNKIQNPKDKITRMLLSVVAYHCGKKVNSDFCEKINSQKDLLPEKWEIEHIFPQKYKKSDFPNMASEQIDEIIECIGNKMPLEKKINCEAKDGFFEEKKKRYEKTAIALAKDLAESKLTDWKFDNINTRKVHTADAVAKLMKKWDE